jgi:hypothetical protein
VQHTSICDPGGDQVRRLSDKDFMHVWQTSSLSSVVLVITSCFWLHCTFRTALQQTVGQSQPVFDLLPALNLWLERAWHQHCQLTERTTSNRPYCNNPKIARKILPDSAGSYMSCSSDASCRIFIAEAAFCASTTASS